MEIIEAINSKVLEFVIFMVIPAVVYLVFVILTFKSSDSSLLNKENDHWSELANANYKAVRDGESDSEEESGQADPVRIEMLSNGMMVKRGGKPKTSPESSAKL